MLINNSSPILRNTLIQCESHQQLNTPFSLSLGRGPG